MVSSDTESDSRKRLSELCREIRGIFRRFDFFAERPTRCVVDPTASVDDINFDRTSYLVYSSRLEVTSHLTELVRINTVEYKVQDSKSFTSVY